MDIRCPKCKKLFPVTSSDFGNQSNCPHCNNNFLIDTEHLPHFNLPEKITIKSKSSNQKIIIKYGYKLETKTNNNSITTITKKQLKEAEHEEIMSGLMDHKGDYSLNRYLKVESNNNSEIIDLEENKKEIIITV